MTGPYSSRSPSAISRRHGSGLAGDPYSLQCSLYRGLGECVEALDDLLDLFPPLPIDLYFRDNTADDGDEPSTGTFWNSPDLWVRNAADDGEARQNPWRVRTIGCAPAFTIAEAIGRVGLVGHAIQEWAGARFSLSR